MGNSMAVVSDNLMTVTVVVYSLAMLGYAAEFAFGRVARGEGTVSGQRVLAGVGAREETAEPGVGEGAAAGPDAASGPWDSERGSRARAPTEQSAATPAASTGTAQTVGRFAAVLTVLGWAAHLGSIATRGVAAGRMPWGNMYEFTATLTFAAVTAYLVLLARQRVRYLGLFVMIPVVLGLGVAVTILYAPAGPLVPALDSYWLAIHVTAATGASGIYTVGTAATVLYLIADRHERRLHAGRDAGAAGLARRLPDRGTLDRIAYRTIAFGFPIWTFALIAGAIWAEAAWGRYWGWDPKETWMLITWVVYAGYLHARATAGWKGRRAAVVALVGYAAFLFNYFGVNMINFDSLHSYSGL